MQLPSKVIAFCFSSVVAWWLYEDDPYLTLIEIDPRSIEQKDLQDWLPASQVRHPPSPSIVIIQSDARVMCNVWYEMIA
jgi:hypothetical protein